MDVLVSSDAAEFIQDHGGEVFLRSHDHRCCRGPLTLLEVTFSSPPDGAEFLPIEASGVIVRVRGDLVDQPHVFTVELHGVLRRRLMAYWDGCVYKM